MKKYGKRFIADNTATNLETTRLLKFQHVEYFDHKLDLDMQEKITRKIFRNTVLNIKSTMRQVKVFNNASILKK